jgi:hypothetical protein
MVSRRDAKRGWWVTGPCIEGREPNSADGELPVSAVDIAVQMALGGVFLAGGYWAPKHRSASGR